MTKIQVAIATLWLLIEALVASCSGSVYIVEPPGVTDPLCANVHCESGTYCKSGQCLPIPLSGHPCNPITINGDCAPGEVCVQGTCYSSAARPQACSIGFNGICTDGQTCDTYQGKCTAITNACDPFSAPTGQCQGGQRCIDGWCYFDTALACSSTQLNGVCPEGQQCVNGVCTTLPSSGLCSTSNFTGLCSAWQQCAEGLCIGPVPPPALNCSPVNPTGVCPAREVCVAGVCTEFAADNVCSASNNAGLCAAGAGCSAGRCELITPANACSATNPTGMCGNGASCVRGVCEQTACGQPGGFACSQGQWCANGGCAAVPCDAVHPMGNCVDPTLGCQNGVCQQPTCSAGNPNGVCQAGLVCNNGNCTLPPCSASSQNGPCPTDDLHCVAGVCVKKNCSPQVLDGVCTGSQSTAKIIDPYHGQVSVNAVCCNANVAALTGCSLGTCSAPACSQSPNVVFGACLNKSSDYCNGGQCTPATCTPYFDHGVCSNSNETCVNGSCTLPNCVLASNPNAFCAPKLCDQTTAHTVTYNTCIAPPCSVDPNVGACTPGFACCNPNLASTGDPNCTSPANYGHCITPACSYSYPGGSCSGGDVCVPTLGCSPNNPNNNCCNKPPCSPDYTTGNCGPNFSCGVDANNVVRCLQDNCSPTAPEGRCPQGTLCLDGVTVSDPNYGSCQAFVCRDYYPTAPCPVGQQCVQNAGHYVCQVPSCGLTYPAEPGGRCANSNQVCVAGVCITPACSPNFLIGSCPASQLCCDTALNATRGCELGTCTIGSCSPNNTDGYCSPGKVCCDSHLIGSYVGCPNNTTLGTCVAQVCSPTYPAGPCTGSQICVGGACVTPCSSTARTGWCSSGFACVDGACVTACAGDRDCDNIADSIECPSPGNPNSPATCADFDSDGSPNLLDRDSDSDTIPDAVEKGCIVNGTSCLITTPPLSTTASVYDFLNRDADGDHIADMLEAGPVPSVPRDTDQDGRPDYRDRDSDNDGILDICEATDFWGPCQSNNSGPTLLTTIATQSPTTHVITGNPNISVVDNNQNGKPDYLDLDSDSDGVSDNLEATFQYGSANAAFNPNGVYSSTATAPDYRNSDSDGDGVPDKEEDKNGNGYADCQLDGNGKFVADTRAAPSCSDSSFWYNPGCNCSTVGNPNGCVTPHQKCLFGETSRVKKDTNVNSIADPNDGIYLVCGSNNQKPINIFYSQVNDYAFALEQSFTTTQSIVANGNIIGMAFDDPNNTSGAINGSYAVSGFILAKTPSSNARLQTTAQQKALIQAQGDGALFTNASYVATSSLVINRNFTSFDGYSAVVSRFHVTTSSMVTPALVRDALVVAVGGATSFASTPGNVSATTANDFTVLMQTLYRDDVSTPGRVIVVMAVVPTGADQTAVDTYNYRPACSGLSSGACSLEHGCIFTAGSCTDRSDYQIPLFFADNIINGSALAQYGSDLAALCQSLVQQNGVLDFVWVVDNSISMAPKIGQVSAASGLFFGLLNNTEADYRVGMVTSAPSLDNTVVAGLGIWEPVYPGCFAQTTQAKCETDPQMGGCSWDTCTAHTTQATCTAVTGCTWSNSNCLAPASASTCSGYSNYTTCSQVVGCTWNGSACVTQGGVCAPMCTAFTSSTSCASAGCSWNSSTSTCSFGGCTSVTDATICARVGCYWNVTTTQCVHTSRSDRSNGSFVADFTGAISGQYTSASAADRSVTYQCSEGCATEDQNATLPSGMYDQCSALTSQGSSVCNAYSQCIWKSGACVANCCPQCNGASPPTGAFQSAACYFASRLPGDDGNGFEFGLLMGEWAMYRAGARSGCAAIPDSAACAATAGCVWYGYGNNCMPAYCSGPSTIDQCNGNYPTVTSAQSSQYGIINTLNYPAGPSASQAMPEPPACEWDPAGQACVPSIGQPCESYTSQTTCPAPRCSYSVANGGCHPNTAMNDVQCSGTDPTSCYNQGPNWCVWDTCSGHTTASECASVYGCAWSGTCAPADACAAYDSSTCQATTDCQWNGSACAAISPPTGTCRPPLTRAIRANATRVAVLLSDEEECYVKDGNSGGIAKAYDGRCEWANYGGGLLSYNDANRLIRTSAYLNAYAARNFLTFALVGDKADPNSPAGPPASATSSSCPTGCTWYSGDPSNPNQVGSQVAYLQAVCVDSTNPNRLCPRVNGGCYSPIPNGPGLIAEAGQAYINVAEGTGGGWGSICATNLYPSIEATVIASISKASPYHLNGFVNGHAVQPISSSIQVGVQTCKNYGDYPGCLNDPNNTTVIAPIPRSRTNGFDYDPTNNALVLYGSARAYTAGDIVVSYRYWVNNNEPAAGADLTCPCPGTSAPTCACPAGQSCGVSGQNPVTASNDKCLPANNPAAATQAGCNTIAGCTWNTVIGCEPTGVCKADPTCGGPCPTGHICDSSTGLCVCDLACGSGCSAGRTCDADTNTACTNQTSASGCNNTSGCAWNHSAGVCESSTCGTCLCDTSCGGGCPAGQACDTNPADSTCGRCLCDTTCHGGCPANQVCNSDPNSATCGFCEPPVCRYIDSGGTSHLGCPPGGLCDFSTGTCVCDPSCGGGCRIGAACDSNPNSLTCGQCLCQTNCGGVSCPAGEICDSNPADTSTCGLCVVDSTCGGGKCNDTCAGATVSACTADPNCIWKSWKGGGAGACGPAACKTCDPTTGLCTADPTCCGGCGPLQICNTNTGSCVCDTTCNNACQVGHKCDTNPTSATCGQCLCDTTCGGTCPHGDRCDTTPNSPTCGQCIIDSTCGGGCPYPYLCSATTGLCIPPPCGGCPTGYVCNSITQQCTPQIE